MAKHWRILGALLLALTGALAVNASAAQAKWLLLVNKVSVAKATLVGSSEGGYLLFEGGNVVHCNGSTGTAVVEAKGTLLGVTATAVFTGCTQQLFLECNIHSPGQPNGTIIVTVSGDADMGASSEEIWIDAEGTNGVFTDFEYSGTLCLVNGAKDVITGKAKITVLKALQDLKLHEIHILGEELKLGEENIELHMLSGETTLPLLLGSVAEAGGGTISVHLCELPGAPKC